MKRLLGIPALITLFALGSCFPTLEDDLNQAIERDDRLLKEYLQRNNLTPIETQLGYFYSKDSENPTGAQITNGDIVGAYYEIRTIDGQLIESYLDESKPARLYRHLEGGLIPRAINFASGLAKTGESFTLYIPSYLAYQDYSYQQLILPNSNLVVKVKYVAKFSETELQAYEDGQIQSYLTANALTGYEKSEEGIHIKTLSEGASEGTASIDGSIVRIEFKISYMGSETAILESTPSTPTQITVGTSSNLKFLNLTLKGVKKDAEYEMLVPSHLGFGQSPQVFPFVIRRDLFDKGFVTQVVRPYEPIYFKVKVVEIR
jgi:FKBP-type peptidyl-prolyl cis-trans isomerase 2